MSEDTLLSKLSDLKLSIQGLHTEVVNWRTHTSSTGDFILIELESVLSILNAFIIEMRDQIKAKNET